MPTGLIRLVDTWATWQWCGFASLPPTIRNMRLTFYTEPQQEEAPCIEGDFSLEEIGELCSSPSTAGMVSPTAQLLAGRTSSGTVVVPNVPAEIPSARSLPGSPPEILLVSSMGSDQWFKYDSTQQFFGR